MQIRPNMQIKVIEYVHFETMIQKPELNGWKKE